MYLNILKLLNFLKTDYTESLKNQAYDVLLRKIKFSLKVDIFSTSMKNKLGLREIII